MTTFAAGDQPTAVQLNDIQSRFAYKTSDETVNNTTTLQNDDFLFLTVAASTKYEFEILIVYNTGVTPDLKFGWTLPTGATNLYGCQYYDGTNWVALGSSSVPTTGVALGGFAGDLMARFQGSLNISTTAGTMQIQWAQNTLNASNTTIRAGSYLRLDKMS